jgi:hypothetical protein
MIATLRRLRIGDTAALDLRRGSSLLHINVVLPGYDRPRVRLVDAATVTPEQRARRSRWLTGW